LASVKILLYETRLAAVVAAFLRASEQRYLPTGSGQLSHLKIAFHT